MNNTPRSRSQSLGHLDRQHRIEERETQDLLQRTLPHQEIILTPEAQEHQSTGLESQLRQRAEQNGLSIFGLSGPEMQSRRNQQVDQQANNRSDSHSETEELRQGPISRQEQEKVMELWVDLRDAQPLEQQRRSLSVNDALQQLSQYSSIARSIRNGDYAWEHKFIHEKEQELKQGR